MANIEERVEMLIKPKIQELGYELYDVYYIKEGKAYILRVFIDKEEGIGIEDCEIVNNGIMELLDEADYIKEAYYLEISSPGIERVLRKDKQLEENLGTNILIKLFKPINGEKELSGKLESFNDKEIVIKEENDEKKVPREMVSLIKTLYDWE